MRQRKSERSKELKYLEARGAPRQHIKARIRGQAKEISDPIFDLVVADVDVLWDQRRGGVCCYCSSLRPDVLCCQSLRQRRCRADVLGSLVVDEIFFSFRLGFLIIVLFYHLINRRMRSGCIGFGLGILLLLLLFFWRIRLGWLGWVFR